MRAWLLAVCLVVCACSGCTLSWPAAADSPAVDAGVDAASDRPADAPRVDARRD